MTAPQLIRPEIRARYPSQVAACEALKDFASANRPAGPPTPDPAGDAILKTYARSSKTYLASMLLAGHGYGEQAGMVNRSLFEDMIVAHWIRRSRAAAEKIERHGRLQVVRFREAAHRLRRDDLLAELPDPSPREREALVREFRSRQHWTGKTMDELVTEVRDEWAEPLDRRFFDQVWELDHRMNNVLLHHGRAGLNVGIDERPAGLTYKSGPSSVHVREAFGSAFFSYVNTVSLVLTGEEPEALNALYAEHVLAFVRVAPDGKPMESSDGD